MENNDQNSTSQVNRNVNADSDPAKKVESNTTVNDDAQAKTVFRKSTDKIVENAEDKTVFATKSISTKKLDVELSNDKTVIANKVHQPSVDQIDVTQTNFTENVSLPDDATIFSPRSVPTNKNTNVSNEGIENATVIQSQPSIHKDNVEQNVTENVNQHKLLKDRFVLEEILGIGGMGIVYKAKDLLRVEAQDRDPYVAIKVLSEEFKTHPEAFISLQRESKKAQHIANQNTVKVYDFDRDGDVVFMTMEYMIGEPLDQLVKKYHATGLPRIEAWNIMEGMCLALIHAHSENIVHSDLKPGNVFVTDAGVAKIFDFGIARAVAKIDRSNNEKDRTVFDAGNLGALTPAYASREMLLGQTPDVRDDIYALGCIAYEILTGDHPFRRLPADEAYDKKLKPKRIQGIKKRHWKAIEAALAFERKDRIISVQAFYKQITEKRKSYLALWFAGAVTLAASGYAYTELTKEVTPQISQAELMNQLEFKVRYELLQENIARFLASPTFTSVWQNSLWKEMETAKNLFPEKPTPWYFDTRASIFNLYIEEIKKSIATYDYALAESLIAFASRYTDDMALLDEQSAVLAGKIASLEEERRLKAEADKALSATNQIEEAKKREALAAQQAKQALKNKQAAANAKEKEKVNLFNLAMANVDQHLICKQRINMRDFKIAIEKLRSLDLPRYQKSEKSITTELAACISAMGEISPDYAKEAKRSALLLFQNNDVLMAVQITEKDRCQVSIAGLGAKGSRAVCKDALKTGGEGPTMVVVPSGNKLKAFAIGKYEISVAEYNEYCSKSNACKINTNVTDNLPVTEVSITDIKNYIKWLNIETGQKYRIPTQREWVYAANANDSRLDSNRNCQISSRGISKGKELIKITTGKQNNWGLVNYAGNAQELVYGSGKTLIAVGGSYQTSMDDCTDNTASNHSGAADQQTGFRLVRSIVGS
ncbi:protein kinase [Psychromonas sp.]|nr:protein kinase [Psychromonas sp.]